MGDVASIDKEALRSAHKNASELQGEVLSGPGASAPLERRGEAAGAGAKRGAGFVADADVPERRKRDRRQPVRRPLPDHLPREEIVHAPSPDLTVEKGRPGLGLLASVVVSNNLDGLPLYRD